MNRSGNNGLDQPGQVTVIKGEAKVIDPCGAGSTACICPGKGVSVLINGVKIFRRTPVYSTDRIQIETAGSVEPAKVSVRIAPDGMSAEAVLFPPLTVTHTLPDYPPSPDLEIDVVAREEYGALSLEEALGLLREQGVTFGLDEKAITELLNKPGDWGEVARGRPVVPGRDGWVEPQHQELLKKVVYGENENRVDYRERFKILHVQTGDLLARICPPVPGTVGKQVTGREVAAPPVFPAEVQCGKGATLSPDGSQVFANRVGAPVYRKGKIHLFRVDNLYVHQGNIDIRSGNTAFQGHLKIQGDIMEGMSVSAEGEIEIAGHATGANISAEGQVIIKNNCINCHIEAGRKQIVRNEFGAYLKETIEVIDNVGAACRKIISTLEKRGQKAGDRLPLIMRMVVQSKFPAAPQQVMDNIDKAERLKQFLPEKVLDSLHYCAGFFGALQNGGRPVDFTMLKEIRIGLARAVAYLDEGEMEGMGIVAHYVQNSTLLCTGDITISGPGVYNSTLKCNGAVRVERIFRGGKIGAGGDVWIGKAGTARLSVQQGLIQVPPGNKIHLGLAYENMKVQIGPSFYTLKQTLTGICLALDPDSLQIRIQPRS